MLLQNYWGENKMAQELIEKFNQVNELYELVIPKSEEAFKQLKADNNKEVEELNQELTLMSFDLTEELKRLTQMIERKCEERNVEKKIPNLLPFYSVEEKETLMAALKTAIHYDRKYKNNLMMYRCLAEAKHETSETIVEMWRYIAQEEGGANGKMFINRKL